MNKKVLIALILLSGQVKATDFQDVKSLALNNGFKPSNDLIEAVVLASQAYHINSLDLASIAILETGFGKYSKTRINTNGSKDYGLFQINSINLDKCYEYNLDSTKGNALCAAKLLSNIKKRYESKDPQWKARYHSKTKSHKNGYYVKIQKVLAMNE